MRIPGRSRKAKPPASRTPRPLEETNREPFYNTMDSTVISTTGSLGADTGSPEGTVAPEEGQPEEGCRCDLQAGELAIRSQDHEPQAREGSGQRPWGGLQGP